MLFYLIYSTIFSLKVSHFLKLGIISWSYTLYSLDFAPGEVSSLMLFALCTLILYLSYVQSSTPLLLAWGSLSIQYLRICSGLIVVKVSLITYLYPMLSMNLLTLFQIHYHETFLIATTPIIIFTKTRSH